MLGRTDMSTLLPFERAILNAVGAALPSDTRALYEAQLGDINKVQRLLEWNEIEFYCMRWFKVRWPEQHLFPSKAEIALGSGVLSADELSVEITVWAVGGHVFSIESKHSLKPFKDLPHAAFALASSAAQQAVPADGPASRAHG